MFKNPRYTSVVLLLLTSIILLASIILYNKAKRINNKINQISNYILSTAEKIDPHHSTIYLNKNKININEDFSRERFLQTARTFKGSKLEIGPWFNPSLKGDEVKYFDVFNKEQLLSQARKLPELDKVNSNSIPFIHYTDPNGSMSSIDKKFDLIFSSHNIEHQVDLVKHLQEVESHLVKKGKFFIAIPDKRYTFDHFVPLVALSDVLAVYWSKEKTHSLQTILEMRCETTHNESIKHWRNVHGEPVFFNQKNCYSDAYKEFQDSNGSYIDSHKWRLTPETFLMMITELSKMNLISLKVEKIWNTSKDSNEFGAILVKD